MSESRWLLSAFACSSVLFFCHGVAVTAIHADQRAIDQGKQAMTESADYPWYDKSTDTLRQVPLRKTTAPGSTNRQSSWTSSPSASNSPPPTTPAGPGWNFGSMNVSWITAILWVGIAMFLMLVVGLLLWAFFRREKEDTGEIEAALKRRHETDVERLENLPVQVRTRGDLLDEARAAYEQGNYRDAMIYLYSHMLMQMDRKHWIRLAKSKTNRQYLQEVRANRSLASIFRPAMLSFEDVFFGYRPLNKDEFEGCWQNLSEFEKALQQSPEGTS
jgi:hypothetical protein